MTRDPRRRAALCSHVVLLAAVVWHALDVPDAGTAHLITAAVLIALLLPGFRFLSSDRTAGLTMLSLALVIVIGAAIVEVIATGARLPAAIMLAAALFEFAVLLILARSRR